MPALTRRPDQPYLSLRDAMNQLFSEAVTPFFAEGATNGGVRDGLPVNVYEDGEKFYVHVMAPGVDPAAVEITAANGVLYISAKQQPLAREGWRAVWQEFQPAEHRRQLRLPLDFDVANIQATYQNGILLITVPKAEHIRPKSIKVQVGS